MFNFLKRSKPVPFNIALIGDRWTRSLVTNENKRGKLHVREVPPGIERNAHQFVALIQPDQSIEPSQYDEWTDVVQRSLEFQGKALLVVTHTQQSQITWYAYSGTRESLEETLYAQRQSHPVRWGINEDARWEEYEFSRKLAGG